MSIPRDGGTPPSTGPGAPRERSPSEPPRNDTQRLVGATLCDQYQLVEVIGEGGMGVVFRARQLAVGRDVAVKVLQRRLATDEQCVARFENEARAISRLRHPNTLRLYDVRRTDEGDLFIVTELLSGMPLSRLLSDQGRIPAERALKILDQVCRSLAEAHGAGIIHRDLKPENVFLDRVGSEDVVKVLDFGIAKILQGSSSITRLGFVAGTPAYMSPEQAQGLPVDHRSDIYSLGVMLFEMITGQPPYQGETGFAVCLKHIEAPLPTLDAPGLGLARRPIEKLIHHLMAKSPEERPQHVDALRRALEDLGDLGGSEATPISPTIAELPPLGGEGDRTLTADPTLVTETETEASPPEMPLVQPVMVEPLVKAEDDTYVPGVLSPVLSAPLSRAPSRSEAPDSRGRWTFAVVGLLVLLAAVLFAGRAWVTQTEVVPLEPNPSADREPAAPVAPARVIPREPAPVASSTRSEVLAPRRAVTPAPLEPAREPPAASKKRPVRKPPARPSDALMPIDL